MKITYKILLSFFITGLLLTGITVVFLVTGIPIFITMICVPIVASLIGFLVSKIFSKPIHQLCEGTEIIRSGNLEYLVSTDSKDEIGLLSRTFAEMAEDLLGARTSIDNLSNENAKHEETERELQAREEHFRRLFEHSNDAVFIYNFEGEILDVNSKACDMLDYSKEDLLKISFLELHTEEELTRSKAAFKTGTETCSIRFESKLRKKDGSIIDVEISSSVVDIKKGIMQCIVSNITERKRMEEALRMSEEKFRTFMETASDLMFISDKHGNITYVNQSMVGALGYTKEEMIGMTISEIMDKESVEESKKRRAFLIAEGEDSHELVLEAKNRRKISGEMKASGIFDGAGQFQGIRSVFRDTTDRKKIEESQRLSQLGRLAADVAHEVKNQITVISGMAELSLMDLEDDTELAENVKDISDQCHRINDVVRRLLMFSKPSTGDFKEVNINDPVTLVADMVEKKFSYDKVLINKEFTSPLLPVLIDEKQMLEVFMNLLQNANEAMVGGGTITIRTSKQGNDVRIDIKDTGGGITEDDMKKIFDPFFTTKVSGTGLGLSACYGIVQAHRGNISYSSQLGEGTTATILLPIVMGTQNVETSNN